MLWASYTMRVRNSTTSGKRVHAPPNDTLMLFQAGQVLLDMSVDDGAVPGRQFCPGPGSDLRAAVEETAGLVRPRPDAAIDFLASGTVTFASSSRRGCRPSRSRQDPAEPVLQAVETIRTLDAAPTPRPVPKETSLAIVTDPWRPISANRGRD